MNCTLTHKVSILMVSYPYTLNLTAPITVVINDNLNTGGNVLFGATTSLRRANEVRVITLSGANAVAGNRPEIASVVPGNRAARGRLLGTTTSLRGGDRRPLTGTMVSCTRDGGVVYSSMSVFGTLPKGNLDNAMGKGGVFTNGLGFVGAGTRVSPNGGRVTRELSNSNGAPLFFTLSNGLLNVVTITSIVGSSDPGTIGRLEGVKVHIIVLANSGRHATGTVNGSTNISRMVTKILPDNGRRTVGGLGGLNGITVINSKVGSTPTLAETSVNLTVNTNASITVSTTSIILVGDHLSSMPTTVELDETALEGVRRGLF